MSLKELAKQVRAEGRGKDDQLVHLTSREVQGLHQLAKAAGGKLTTNPKTGLPEAGFLDSLLPTILGFAANFVLPGSGMYVGAATGALQNKENPLMGAVLGGMGGYGGAQLGAGLQGLGTGAAQQAAMTAPGTLETVNAAQQAALQQAATGPYALDVASGVMPPPALEAGNMALSDAAIKGTDTFLQKPFYEQAQGGLEALIRPGGPTQFAEGMGGLGNTAKAAGMAAAPAIYDYMRPKPMATQEESQGEIPEYRYAAEQTGDYYGTGGDFGTYERNYFTSPTYQRLAEGGPAKPAGATAGAMDYLMGKTAQSPAAVQAQQFTAQRAAAAPVQPIIDRSAMPADFMPAATPQRRAFSSLNWKMRGDSPQRATGTPRYTERRVADGYSFDPASQQFVPKYRMEYDPIVTDEFGKISSRLDRRLLSGASLVAGGRGIGGLFGRNKQASGNPQYRFDPNTQQFSRMAEGGLASLANGGSTEHMGSGDFIISSDVTAYAGGGSTRAGQEKLSKKLGARPINGAGDGLSDDIPATIDGKPVAKVADGEMRVPREQVAKLGKGNPKKGAKKLYAMMDNIRKQAVGHKKQVRPVNIDKALA